MTLQTSRHKSCTRRATTDEATSRKLTVLTEPLQIRLIPGRLFRRKQARPSSCLARSRSSATPAPDNVGRPSFRHTAS